MARFARGITRFARFVCGKCGHETEDVRCRPKACTRCGVPPEESKK